VRRLFLRGLVGAVPVAATVAFLAIDYVVAARVTLGAARGIESAVEGAAGKERAILSESPLGAWFFSWGSTVAAILLVLLPLFAASLWMATRLGRRLYAAWTRRAERIPVLGLMVAASRALRRKVDQEVVQGRPRSVTIVPFGGPAVALGIVTGGEAGGPLLVLVPSSPFSLQSLLLFVPPDRARPAPISVDQLLRSVASWGIVPPREKDHPPSTGSGLGMTTSPDSGSTK
jgi:uncharacterized membrane protein